jgi:hypothetical protein
MSIAQSTTLFAGQLGNRHAHVRAKPGGPGGGRPQRELGRSRQLELTLKLLKPKVSGVALVDTISAPKATWLSVEVVGS